MTDAYLRRSYAAQNTFPTNEEDQPPKKKAKATVTIASLFDQHYPTLNITKAITGCGIGRPTDGTTKSRPLKSDFFARFTKPKQLASHPVYLRFAEVADEYRTVTGTVRGEQLAPVYDELAARVDGLDVDGKPWQMPGLPSKAEIDAIMEDDAALSQNLDEEHMTVQNRRKNGTVEVKEVKLGDTMTTFASFAATKRAELDSLIQELEDAEMGIRGAQEHLVAAEKGEVTRSREEFESMLTLLKQSADDVLTQTRDEVKELRKEDSATRAEMDRKIEQFMKNM